MSPPQRTLRIFISHSSVDTWLAERIRDDLRALGAGTFLDVENLESGDDVNETLRAKLEQADEIVLVVSPAAVASRWVTTEASAAWALRKRIVPILLHVSANEMPFILEDCKHRDLNEIGEYYREVAGRLAQAAPVGATRTIGPVADPAPPPSRVVAPMRAVFTRGTHVRIPDRPQAKVFGPKGTITWAPGMTVHAGKRATVVDVDSDRSVKLDVDGTWWWAMDWLEIEDPASPG